MKRVSLIISSGIVFLCLLACEGIDSVYDYREKLAEEIAEIEDYLSANEIEAEVDISGMRFVVTDPGDGEIAKETNYLTFVSTIRRMDGQPFQTEDKIIVDQFEMYWSLQLTGVVRDHRFQCYHEAAKYIGQNGRITMYVPSVLALRSTDFMFGGWADGLGGVHVTLPGDVIFIIEANLVAIN